MMIFDPDSDDSLYPLRFSDDFRQQARGAKASMELYLTVHYDLNHKAALDHTGTVVFGGNANLSGLWVDDRYVADYVAGHPDTQLGFLSLDPTNPE